MCAGAVEEWDADSVAKAPEAARPYLRPRNAGALTPNAATTATQGVIDADVVDCSGLTR